MKHLLFFLFSSLATITFAQQGVLTTGVNATGSGGSASYSVGQLTWNMFTGNNSSVIQGTQQPYEISVLTSISNYEVTLNYVIYPNPTLGKVTLNINDTDIDGLKYQLFNLSGVMLQEKNIETVETEIHIESYKPSTYFLRILQNQQAIKLFKIVKN